jgi:hypothetical protein
MIGSLGNMEVVVSFLSYFARKWVELLRRSITPFSRERVKIRFLISNVSAGNMLPASYRLSGPALRCNNNGTQCYKTVDKRSFLEHPVVTMINNLTVGHIFTTIQSEVIVRMHCGNNGNRVHCWLTKASDHVITSMACAYVISLE